ncbi:MAG TPA: hypothetical protein VNP92_03850 [Actinophytocola sp.]|nr:hypothetical protein [Actinophytocola sp.]
MSQPESEPDAQPLAEPTRRRTWILAIAGLVVVVLVVTGVIVVSMRNDDAPTDAVREYLDAIARGDGPTANALVDPRSFAKDVDPKLLTDALRSAKKRITVEEVNVAKGADLNADMVGVEVAYRLNHRMRGGLGARGAATLRVKRAGTTAGVLDEWQVIDPLLVPFIVENNQAWLRPASLDGTPVPVSGPALDGWPERRFYVYPGVYELHGHKSRYLKATPQTVVAESAPSYDERPHDGKPPAEELYLRYEASAELTSTVADRLTDHVTACFAAVPKVPDNCPGDLSKRLSYVTDIRLTQQPDPPTFDRNALEYYTDDELESSWSFQADNGSFSFIDEDFPEDDEQRTESLTTYGSIDITPDDDLTVTFNGG